MNTIHNIDCLSGLRQQPDRSVNMCVTSPPYFGLRDYGVDGQIGLEDTPEAFIARLVDVFREVRRVMKDDGTLWVNIGDSYASAWACDRRNVVGNGSMEKGKRADRPNRLVGGLKEKDLIGIPWMLAFALRADGWYLRQDCIWAKPNPMPENVTDRCTKSHEYLFLLSKSQRYYYDHEAIKEPVTASTIARLNQDLESQKGSDRVPGKTNGTMKAVVSRSGNKERKSGSERGCPEGSGSNVCGSVPWEGDTRNKRSVWTVATKPFADAHFATFPEELIIPCIKAGCPPKGLVLDPFMGAGTTALVARKLGRNYVGYELNPDYIAIAERRLHNQLGPLDKLFA